MKTLRGLNIGLVLGMALVLRLMFCFVFLFPAPEKLLLNVDATGYHQLAVNLLEGHGFGSQNDQGFAPEFLRTPGYPFFMMLLYKLAGTAPQIVILVQVLLDVISIYILYLVGRRVISREAGIVAAAVRAFDPGAIVISNSLMSETLFLFLILLSIFICCYIIDSKSFERKQIVYASLCIGLAALVRPVGLYFGLLTGALLIFFLWKSVDRKPLMRGVALYYVVFAIIVSPWIVRNYTVTGSPFFSTSANYNLLFENALYVQASLEGTRQSELYSQRLSQFQELREKSDGNDIQVSDAMKDTALSLIFGNPVKSLSLFLQAFAGRLIAPHRQEYGALMYGDFAASGSPGKLYNEGLASAFVNFLKSPGGVVAVAELVYLLAVWVLVIRAIACTLMTRHRPVVLFNILVILYFLVVPGLLLLGRMRAPAMPSIAFLVGFNAISKRHAEVS